MSLLVLMGHSLPSWPLFVQPPCPFWWGLLAPFDEGKFVVRLKIHLKNHTFRSRLCDSIIYYSISSIWFVSIDCRVMPRLLFIWLFSISFPIYWLLNLPSRIIGMLLIYLVPFAAWSECSRVLCLHCWFIFLHFSTCFHSRWVLL